MKILFRVRFILQKESSNRLRKLHPSIFTHKGEPTNTTKMEQSAHYAFWHIINLNEIKCILALLWTVVIKFWMILNWYDIIMKRAKTTTKLIASWFAFTRVSLCCSYQISIINNYKWASCQPRLEQKVNCNIQFTKKYTVL